MRWGPYPRYRESGVEWLREVPEHWQVDRTKWSVSALRNGVWGEEPDGEDDIICVRVADFDRQRFRVVHNPPTMRAVEQGQRHGRVLQSGDLLIEKSGGGEHQLVGAVVSFDHDFEAVCSNFIARIAPAKGAWPRFWAYVHASMYSGRLPYPSIKQTTGIQNLDSTAYFNELAPFPSLDEQRAIAAFLDRETARLDTLVGKKRQLIGRLREKRTALISHTVTRGLPPDEAARAGLPVDPPLKDSGVEWIGEVPGHWALPPMHARYRIELGKMLDEKRISGANLVPYLRNIDVQWDRINTNDLPEMDIRPEERHRFTLAAGDLLVCEGGEVGRAAIWRGATDTVGYQKALHRLRPRTRGESSRFMFYTLTWVSSAGVFEAEGNPNTIFHLTGEKLRRYRFPTPPPGEQRAISAYLDRETAKIDRLVATIEEAIDRLQEYRAALITAAVTGKIDVRGEVAQEYPDEAPLMRAAEPDPSASAGRS